MVIPWNEIVSEILTKTLPILAVWLIGWIAKWITEAAAEFRMQAPSLAHYLDIAARIGYNAAEEAGAVEHVTNKLECAIQSANAYLEANGFDVDLAVISDAVIDYGVKNNLFSWQKTESENGK